MTGASLLLKLELPDPMEVAVVSTEAEEEAVAEAEVAETAEVVEGDKEEAEVVGTTLSLIPTNPSETTPISNGGD